MHTVGQPMTPASLYLRVMVPRVPGRGARGPMSGRMAYARELEPPTPHPAPWRRRSQTPGTRYSSLGTYQRAAGYALQNVAVTDPLREIKVHTRALAAEALVQVHHTAARSSLRRLHFTDRQISQLLRAARRPQPMRGATPTLTVIDEVSDGAV